MPRTEARVFNTIWKDPHFISLPGGAQRLYLFLLSQDDLSYCGRLILRQSGWARKCSDLTVADIERDLKWLEGTDHPTAYPDPESAPTPLAVIDYDTGELLIRSLLRRDGIWRQPNLLKLARESAESVDSRRIRGVLLAELRRLPLDETGSEQVKTLVADFIADLEKGEPYPTAYPPPYPPDDPSRDPSDLDYACARGNGDRNVPVLGYPDPLVPVAPTSLPAQRDKKRGFRLPDNFALTPDMLTWAAEHAPHVDARLEFDSFGDYWRSKPGRDGCKLDWRLTWNNWMRNAEKRQGPRARPQQQQQQQRQQQQVTDDLFRRNMEREVDRGSVGELT
jgi:hypothetical protein